MRTEPPAGDELTRMLVTMKRNVLDEASREPAPARRRARNRTIIASTAILLTLGLGAGASIAAGMIGEDEEPGSEPQPAATVAAAPVPAPAPTPFGIETAPPVDPLTLVTTISVRPAQLELLDASGVVVATIGYEDDGATAAAVLSTVFGEPPQVEERFQTSGELSDREYLWNGVTLMEYFAENSHRAGTRLWVQFGQPTIGDGVAVDADGFAPGEDIEAYAIENGKHYIPDTGGAESLIIIETGPPAVTDEPDHYHSVIANKFHDRPGSTVSAPFDFGNLDFS
ncbi:MULTISPECIES: hypothetical protein [unclassified Agromyces]|uniref:hypothetical protein n=1 Tax=unclassified Agromyces TaxID=2639701 RepID=UPI00301473C6